MSPSSRVAACLTLLLPFSACGTGEDGLFALEPRLEADRALVELPEADLGQLVSADLFLSNPGGGTTHFTARLEPSSTELVLDTPSGQVTREHPFRVGLSHLGISPGFQAATLVVDHDGAANQGGERRLRVAIQAFTRPPPDCEDHNPCTLDRVDPNAPRLCLHIPVDGTCDDANACTTADHCVEGACVGTAVTCDDGIACTANTCDPVQGCVFPPRAAACDDGDPCTRDTCVPDSPVRGCTHQVEANGTPCGASACDNVSLCVAGACTSLPTPEGYPCDDGDPCTRSEACHAGTCVPAEGGPSTLGPAVLVTEPYPPYDAEVSPDGGTPYPTTWTGDARVAGHWPVALDGVLTFTAFNSYAGNADVMLLWRGVDNPNGMGCYLAPSECTQTGSCAPGGMPPLSTHLLLTHANASGNVLNTITLDVEAPYRQWALSQGVDFPSTRAVPSSSILNVAVATTPGALLGVALVAFADGCETCIIEGDALPPLTPQQDPVDAGPGSGTAQRPPCMPAGNLLIVFEASADSMRTISSRWLGTSYYGAGISSPPLRVANGLPLVAAAFHDGQLGVAYGTMDGCGDFVACDSISSGSAVHLLVFPLATNAECVQGLCGTPFSSLGTPTEYTFGNASLWGMADPSLVGGNWCLGWTQPAPVDPNIGPPRCSDGEPVRDAWQWCSMGNDLLPNPRLVKAGVRNWLPQDDGSSYTWTRGWTPDCTPEDTVDFTPAQGSPVQASVTGLPLQSAAVSSVMELNVLLGTNQEGRIWGLRPDGTTFLGGFTPNTEVQLSPLHAPRAQGPASGAVVGSVAEVGINRNALPTPSLAVMPWQCGN